MRTNRGQGLVSAMVAAGIVAALGLYIAKMSRQSSQTVKSAKGSLEIQTFVSRVTKILTKRNECTNYMDGTSTSTTIDMGPLTYNGVVIMQVGMEVPGSSFVITEIKFLNDGTRGDHLRVNFEKTQNNDGFGANEIVRYFPLDITYETANPLVVETCYSLDDDTIDTSLQLACEEFLGGTFVNGTCENSSMCALEEEMMRLNGNTGTTSCGKTFAINSVSQTISSSAALTFPNVEVIGNVIEVSLLGAGGGGGGSDMDEAGEGGGAGQETLTFLNVKLSSNCSISIGNGGNGSSGSSNPGRGQAGGPTSLICSGQIVTQAEGGYGGRGEAISGCGSNGGGVYFDANSTSYPGGAGGCKRVHGSNGSRGAGGGGGGRRKYNGGRGGNGLAVVKYRVLTEVP